MAAQFQRINVCLELSQPGKLQVEIAAVRGDPFIERVDDPTEPAIFSPFSRQGLLDLHERMEWALRASHRLQLDYNGGGVRGCTVLLVPSSHVIRAGLSLLF